MTNNPAIDIDELIEAYASVSNDPLEFVLFAFPWGEGELAGQEGPVEWQRDTLIAVRDGLLSVQEAIRIARGSGHGVGKSALVSWLLLWALVTFEDTKGVVTANTENQLKTKTWAELSKWFRLCYGANTLFKMTLTAIFSADPEHMRTWRLDMVPWSERNTEAFAGLHNKSKRIIIVFDEASAIPDIIWETTEGALTDEDTQIIWLATGNPTKAKGRFRECAPGGKFEHRWNWHAVDSRSVPFTNKKQLQDWIDDYGIDSDFVRVRVLGKFPRSDEAAFIDFVVAEAATNRQIDPRDTEAYRWRLGVDVARFGNDAAVITARRGPDASSRRPIVLRKSRTTDIVKIVMELAYDLNPEFIFVDGGGVGGGVVDQLLQLGLPVYEVQFGAKADEINTGARERFADKRSEMYGALRKWLETGSIPATVSNVDIATEMSTPTFSYLKEDIIKIESKTAMRARGEPSPDYTDSLITTLAIPDFPDAGEFNLSNDDCVPEAPNIYEAA